MTSRHVINVLAVVALSALGLQAQAPAQPPAPPPGPGQSIVPQTPTFRTEVNVVSTDVIVRNSAGQFVSDLNKDDFEVLEDGVAQKVASFTLVHGGRVFNQLAAPPPPPQEGIILPPARPPNDTAGRIFVFFVDDLHLDFRNTGRIRELFQKIRKNLVHDGDMFGIVSTGPSSLSIDMTYDGRRLEEAIKRITGSGLNPSDIIEQPTGSQGPSEVRYRAHVAFSTAIDLMKNLEQVHDRRKALVYVSNGYDFNPFEESRNKLEVERLGDLADQQDPLTDPTRQGLQFADSDLIRELAELTRAANRANTSIYTIDPRGLVGSPDLDQNIEQTDWQNFIRKSQDSLRVLAEETGGIAVVNQNDFDKALKRIDAETSDYYVVGYYSSNPDPTKRTRKIEVKVNRDGLSVWSRKAYTLRRPPQPSAGR